MSGIVDSQELKLLLAERLLAARQGRWPLSFSQQRLWFLDQAEPGSSAYNMPSMTRLTGRLDVAALERALNAIVQRHEILRTRFIMQDGEPFQVIDEGIEFKLPLADLRSVPEAKRDQIVREEAGKPFDLSKDRLFRASLFTVGPDDHVLLVNMHHIVSDEWSFGVFYRELAHYYAESVLRAIPSLPPLPIQYRDYALWQRDWLKTSEYEEEIAYWKEQLGDKPAAIQLATDRPRSLGGEAHGAARWHGLGPQLSLQLKNLARQQRVTLFMLLLAGWKALLFLYTRQPNIIIGCPVAGRTNTESEELIGFFVNTLPLRTTVRPENSFLQLLSSVRDTVLGGFSHQNLPFDKLVQILQPERDARSSPFINVMFFLQHAAGASLDLPGLVVQFLDPGALTAKFDITLAIQETETELIVVAQYNADLFESETIARLLKHYATLLNAAVERPADPVCRLSLLDPDERKQLLIDWNRTQTNFPRDRTIHELFVEQVQQTPDAVAIVFGTESLTYRRLDERANQAARALRRLGVRPGSIVAVVAERSLELIIALLAILKSGAAYAAIDTSLPEQRSALLLDDLSPAAVLLTHSKLLESAPAVRQQHFLARPRICLDSELVQYQSPEGLTWSTGTDRLAYVSFTSGTTGKPKGVGVPHQGVVRLVRNTNYVGFSSEDVFLQLAPVAFDASTFEIWGALLNGARLVIMPPGTVSLSELAMVIKQQRVTTAWFTSGLFNQIVDECPEALKPLKQILTGGDVLSPSHIRKALSMLGSCRLINGYGPTENTTFTCCYDIPPDFDGERSIPIGKPISNTQCYVLDPWLEPAPIGVPGELYCGGAGLASGYLRAPELTREKFVENPFQPGSTLYRTGDLVRYRPDGILEFIGRMDAQVKIRGYRVELGEIEAVILAHPQVRDCTVTTRPDPLGSKQLVAYFTGGQNPSIASDLEQFLRARLPDYMIPSFFVWLPKLPLSRNGKIDRAALPAPEQAAVGSVRARDLVEQKLAGIWESVLNVSPIGVHDTFFSLGGHSLLAIRLLARIEKEFGKTLSVATVFQNPTIARLAGHVRGSEAPRNKSASLVEIQGNGSRPALFLVHGVGGGMFWGYNNLAGRLGQDQPVFAFQSRGLNGQPEFESIEEMAAHYVRELRSFRREGPYYLGGYCFGGVVAYEMARQLEAAGEKVAHLFLVNSNPPNSSYTTFSWTPTLTWRFLKNLSRKAALSLALPKKYRQEFFRRNVSVLLNRMRRLVARAAAPDAPLDELLDTTQYSEQQLRVWQTHVRAMARYHPREYGGAVSLFRSRVHHLFCSFDPTCAWNEFANLPIDLHLIPGAHETVMDEPHVAELASRIRMVLDQVHLRHSDAPATTSAARGALVSCSERHRAGHAVLPQ